MEENKILNNEELERVVGGTTSEYTQYEGIVLEKKPCSVFRVKLDNNQEIEAFASGKCRVENIQINVGDKVVVEVSSNNGGRGRITSKV